MIVCSALQRARMRQHPAEVLVILIVYTPPRADKACNARTCRPINLPLDSCIIRRIILDRRQV